MSASKPRGPSSGVAVGTMLNPLSTPAPPEQPRNDGVPAGSPPPPDPVRFVALDFETADYGRDSACALAIVTVENDTVIDVWTSLIRPPRRDFFFTYLHGIAWEHVRNKPSFGELWGE